MVHVYQARQRIKLVNATPCATLNAFCFINTLEEKTMKKQRFRINRGAQLPEAKRGDSFIVEGRIYPGGTIAPGGTLAAPGPFNPITAAGSIGKWVLRGTFNYDFGEIIAGAEPAVFGTQYFLFDDGRVLVTEGPHAGLTPQLRALTGGGGAFRGAAGDAVEQVIGANVTGLFNQRFTFRINKQSIR
jgi:hypothetical protein